VQRGADAYAGLVGVRDWGGDERVADGLLHGLEPVTRHLHRAVHAARRKRDAAHLRQQLGGALIGQQLVLGRVDRQRRAARAALARCGNALGKVAAVHAPAGAGAGNRAVFDRPASELQLQDLAAFGQDLGGHLRTATPAVAGAGQRHDVRYSGSSTKPRVSPGWPFCPLGLRPLTLR